MEATGGCLCGAVRDVASGEPAATSLCHCFSCRRSTGGPSLAWAIFPKDKVTIIADALAEHESSPGVYRGFCARCGTSLTYRRDNRPGLFDVTTASLDDPEAFAGQGNLGRGEIELDGGASGSAALRPVQHRRRTVGLTATPGQRR